jgi:hypothetical protein
MSDSHNSNSRLGKSKPRANPRNTAMLLFLFNFESPKGQAQPTLCPAG